MSSERAKKNKEGPKQSEEEKKKENVQSTQRDGCRVRIVSRLSRTYPEKGTN